LRHLVDKISRDRNPVLLTGPAFRQDVTALLIHALSRRAGNAFVRYQFAPCGLGSHGRLFGVETEMGARSGSWNSPMAERFP